MIRGRKEGSNYATWFIGFDHDETFGLSPFPELPPQSPRTPVQGRPVSRATSLETLHSGPSRDPPAALPRSVTPVGTQTSGFASTPISTQTAAEETQTQTQTLPPHPISTQTDDPDRSEPHSISIQTDTHTSTEASTETSDPKVVPRSRASSLGGARPRSQDFDLERSRRRRDKDTQGIYKEAFDGAKRAEEFKFRVKFDKLLGDLHLAIEEKNPNGLNTSFASPSYGEVMLNFRDKVKDLLKGFCQRLQLAYESFGSLDSSDNTGQKVKQDISKFIEDLIGETLDLTSDEAVSDLSSLSDDSSPDQTSFEDLLAQAVVSKLLENHRREVSESLHSSNNNSNLKKNTLKDQGTETQDDDDVILKNRRYRSSSTGGGSSDFEAYDRDRRRNNNNNNIGTDFLDVQRNGYSDKHTRERHHSARSISSLSNPDLFNYKSELIPDESDSSGSEKENGDVNSFSEKRSKKKDYSGKEEDRDSDFFNGRLENEDVFNGAENENEQNDITDGGEVDIVKEFEDLKAFVRKTQSTARPKVEAKLVDDSNLCEVKEETLSKTTVDHDEEREDFHARYNVFDRVHSREPALPDFSQFEGIDFGSDEIDPDLLSMNLAIIPEETEEELEQEEEEDEQGRWRANWIFKGKGISPYENMGKKKVSLDADGPLFMMVPQPEDDRVPRIGNRDIDQLSDFSADDLLSRSDLDGSDDDENTYYANTSKELARISGQRKRPPSQGHRRSTGHFSDDSDFDGRSARRKPLGLYDRNSLDYDDMLDETTNHVSGPIVEPSKQEIKLLQNLVPSENDDPKFLVPPESVTIQEGEPVKFSCRVSGTPPTDVFWYREGGEVEELEDSEDVEISSNGDKHSIVLYNISKAMGGQYMCIVLNEKGKAIQYLAVTVKDNKLELKKPEFLKGLKDVEVTEGQSVKFRVKVKGYPPPRISWYKDGELLKSSKSCRLEKFGNRDYILTIDYASMNDDAEYTVWARNVAGEQKMSAQVIVEPQSDLPPRRQRVSSITTSGASDSDSDRATSRRSIISAAGSATSSTPSRLTSPPQTTATARSASPARVTSPSSSLSPSSPSAKAAMRQREDQLHINHLDRKVALTQKRVEDEAQRMQGDAEKDEFSENTRLLSSDTVDVLRTAEEIIQNEKDSSNSSANGPSSNLNSSGANDNVLGDLSLPDTLDDFPLPGLGSSKPEPVKSTLEFALPKKQQPEPAKTVGRKDSDSDEVDFSPRVKPTPEKFKSEVSFPKQQQSKSTNSVSQNHVSPRDSAINQTDPNVNNVSFDSGKGTSLPDVSTSLASSVSSNASSRDYGETDSSSSDLLRQQAARYRGQYSRDFEASGKPEKKKWSVTLDPFSPQAEVVNRQNGAEKEDRTCAIEINVTDLSPSSSLRSSKGDNSSQASSPRQSIDSGVYVNSKKERPPPVHMVGHTREDEVPESRTEFNTDGSIELPSVNRLKAMFSSGQDDDLGTGSFKRVNTPMDIHSITARSVPKEKLEQLRASNQNQTSSSSPSSNFLEVPGSQSSSSSSSQLSSASLQLNHVSSSPSSSSKVTLKPLSASADKTQTQQRQPKISQVPAVGVYRELDPDKDPVLIYPETDPEYMQRYHPQQHHNQQQQPHPTLSGVKVSSSKTTRAPQPPQQQQQQNLNQSSTATLKQTSSTVPSKPPRSQQPKLVVRRAIPDTELDEGKKGGIRIKSGCISARAAFWERKMVDGGEVNDEEFPEMVEDDSNC